MNKIIYYILAEGKDEIEKIKKIVEDNLGEVVKHNVFELYKKFIVMKFKLPENDISLPFIEYSKSLLLMYQYPGRIITTNDKVVEVIDVRINKYEKEFQGFILGIKYMNEVMKEFANEIEYAINKVICKYLVGGEEFGDLLS